MKIVRVDSPRRLPAGELREKDGEVCARLRSERRRDHVVERGRRAIAGAERAEHDLDRIGRLGSQQLQPLELAEDLIDLCVPVGARDRGAQARIHRSPLGGIDHSSLPSSSSRRAMMLRCTSSVPP